jgi:hypothetical protein
MTNDERMPNDEFRMAKNFTCLLYAGRYDKSDRSVVNQGNRGSIFVIRASSFFRHWVFRHSSLESAPLGVSPFIRQLLPS